ncbi:MAG TPA: YtxH domain-containing protein [Syntrophales bacterium]|jgi:gas vesicle protein|nr:YtxH domain-containing protein [Syntrophales bacterium]HPN09504.1 YtxH domain-containing protein [Syntrophales bacterium]HPX80428.1 YtxH domain-containing protein [Syntrophales bacterium]HQB13913.1 YtxH domain-containing protein [Syntrophales bacterium]
MSDRAGDFLKGVLIGGVIGAVVGILYAPKSGRETREDIGRKAEELVAKAKEEYEQALEKSRKTYETAVSRLKKIEETAREKVGELEAKAGTMVEKGKESLEDNKSRLKRAIDAGVEAYKEEKSA